ncbi:unnamed protein product [Allacma fusca]|uniref:Uncharacterized protein n=1 Tax=Allacma fusca TaxID=39272 RepID=A0A8J2JJ06_9HEXA|nr:unnamed protein product [Allacma fusca]
MYAIVDFVKEKAADGTLPCEIVHMSWLSPDMKFCSWPGNSQYCRAFKKGDIPGDGWKKVAVHVKYFSSELNLLKRVSKRLNLNPRRSL